MYNSLKNKMKKTWKACLLSFFILSNPIFSQGDFAIVDSILIEGNKKTKDKIIFRELDFEVGDTIFLENLNQRFLGNEKRLLNTSLFTIIKFNVKNWNTEQKRFSILIEVNENWYLFPAPIFELADRNFNVWWKEQKRSLNRVNYGLSVDHINFTGNKDRIKFKLQFGYTKKYELRYVYPYINKAQTIGFSGNLFYSDNREIGYITQGNKTQFKQFEDERKLLKRFRVSGELNHRPSLFTFQSFRLEFHQNRIDDEIAQDFNPDYFLDGKTSIRFFLFNYDLRYDRRQFNLYPEGGYMVFFNFKKEGLGIFGDVNSFPISLEFEKYQQLSERVTLGSRIKTKTNLNRNKLAFANNTGLGYGADIIHGYELYVMDGMDYVYLKTSARYKLFDFFFNWGSFMPLKQMKLMNIKTYLRMNYHTGYVNESFYKATNDLNNRLLTGYGPALDLVFYNNFLYQIEYSYNHLKEHALYLHSSISF